jgi:hypothetical protein
MTRKHLVGPMLGWCDQTSSQMLANRPVSKQSSANVPAMVMLSAPSALTKDTVTFV